MFEEFCEDILQNKNFRVENLCFTLIMEEMLNLRTRIKRAFTSLRTLLVLFSMTYRRTFQSNRHSENLENFCEWNEHLIFLLFRICYNKYQGYTILANRFRIGVRNDYLVSLANICILFLDCHSGANAPLRNDVKSRKTPTNSVIASVSEAIQYNNQH